MKKHFSRETPTANAENQLQLSAAMTVGLLTSASNFIDKAEEDSSSVNFNYLLFLFIFLNRVWTESSFLFLFCLDIYVKKKVRFYNDALNVDR